MENTNIILTNDSQSHTHISLIIDNSQINHKQLNKFVAELHNLGLKYNLVNIKDGVLIG
ncbi:hypothetical protein G9F72_018835 [Clostridium estertheticum]|uniref:hypothetical protein n=1 Tax=Clostridium estertheticum TaxID=238834 RepID=UPI0013E97831|nr:hypothetical protein [Clostridium estertheticum]MBZ9688389.1 hypothetical protein [Clostridium estertheticum]